MRGKEYEVVKTVQLTFIIEANSPEEAEELAWDIDDMKAFGYHVYDIEVDEEEVVIMEWEDEEE